MKKILRAGALFLIMALMVLNSRFGRDTGLYAQETPPVQQKITLDVKGMDVVDVLKMLATRSGMNLAIGKNVTGRATLFLKDVSIEDAFEIVLLANDLACERAGNIINVMTQRDYEVQYGRRYQDKIKLEIIPLKYSKAADLSKALNQIKTNVGKIIVDENSNTLVLMDTADKIKEMADFISSADLPIQTRIFSLNYAQADKLSPKIQEAITKGAGSIKLDERTNKIAVSDYPQKLDEIAKIISAFDEKTPQVLIDAQIIEINPNKDQFSMGVDWDYWIKKNARLVGSMAAPSLTDVSSIANKFSFGVAAAGSLVNSTGEYKSIVDILRVIGETKILSSPRVMVLNNQEAKIHVGTKEAYITSATSQAGDTSVTSQSVNFVDVGIKLSVTPIISRDGYVTMKIRPEISSSKRTDITSEGKITQIPIVTTSESETSIMVKDGTTIIIAGLKKDTRSKEVKKIPILGDIPLLGFFFRSTKDEVLKTELVIFITPRIVLGDEPLEYTSLNRDKDIAYIQSLAKAQNITKDDDFEDYKKLIIDKVKRTYPLSQPKNKAVKGKVDLSFIIGSSGELIGEPVVLSSPNKELDEAAIECLKKSSPFPSFPNYLKKSEQEFNISLEYI